MKKVWIIEAFTRAENSPNSCPDWIGPDIDYILAAPFGDAKKFQLAEKINDWLYWQVDDPNNKLDEETLHAYMDLRAAIRTVPMG